MTNQENQIKANYILRLDHKFPFEQFDKKWVMYLPGFEGMYAISDDLCLCALNRSCITVKGAKRNLKAKLLKHSSGTVTGSTNDALGIWFYRVSKQSGNHRSNKEYVLFTKKKLLNIISSKDKKELKTELQFPFKYNNKTWIGYLKNNQGQFVYDYVISDDVFVMRLNDYTDINLVVQHKIKKWTLSCGYENLRIHVLNNDGTVTKDPIARTRVLKQVSKILEGMPDD